MSMKTTPKPKANAYGDGKTSDVEECGIIGFKLKWVAVVFGY
jgi:hypothetical protein